MRILQICSARTIGGGERHVADLSNALSDRGHEIFVGVTPRSQLVSELGHVPSANISPFSLRNSVDITSAVKLARLARKNDIEIIHAHLGKDYPIAAAAARLTSIPYVLTRHVLFPMSRVHRRLLSKVSAVIALSNAIETNLRKEGIFAADKIVPIRYGIDTARFPETKRVCNDSLLIGTIGNIDPVKGLDIFVRAAAVVAVNYPTVEFEIIGTDRSRSQRNEARLRRLISELNMDGKIALSGWVADVSAKLAGLDIFVSSSRSESFGAVIAEAMLSGAPVIATETEGAKEIISQPDLGKLVPIDSTEAVAESIVQLINNPAERVQLGRTGRAHVLKNYSLARMVEETEAVYRRVIDKS